jgi:hypothetical protein
MRYFRSRWRTRMHRRGCMCTFRRRRCTLEEVQVGIDFTLALVRAHTLAVILRAVLNAFLPLAHYPTLFYDTHPTILFHLFPPPTIHHFLSALLVQCCPSQPIHPRATTLSRLASHASLSVPLSLHSQQAIFPLLPKSSLEAAFAPNVSKAKAKARSKVKSTAKSLHAWSRGRSPNGKSRPPASASML